MEGCNVRFAFMFYDGMTALDMVGPYEILSRLPGVESVRVANRPGPVPSDSGVELTASAGFADITEADLLLVPGSSSATSMNGDAETLEWVREINATTTWTTSVCTGSLILGRAGLLRGVRATTHWAVHERLRDHGAEPVAARVVEDGKFMTGAGVAAGLDLALALAARIAGPGVAKTLQLAVEYDPDPPFDSGHPSKAAQADVDAMFAFLEAGFVEAGVGQPDHTDSQRRREV